MSQPDNTTEGRPRPDPDPLEPVAVIDTDTSTSGSATSFNCAACGVALIPGPQSICRHCGKPVCGRCLEKAVAEASRDPAARLGIYHPACYADHQAIQSARAASKPARSERSTEDGVVDRIKALTGDEIQYRLPPPPPPSPPAPPPASAPPADSSPTA